MNTAIPYSSYSIPSMMSTYQMEGRYRGSADAGYCSRSPSCVPSGKYITVTTRFMPSGISSSQVIPAPVTWIRPALGVCQ